MSILAAVLVTGWAMPVSAQETMTDTGRNDMSLAAPSTQPVIYGDYVEGRSYEIADVSIAGYQYLDDKIIKSISGLAVGQTIKLPNDEAIADGIRALWKEGMFADIQVIITRITDNRAFVQIKIVERPRMSAYEIQGANKSQTNELKEKLKTILVPGRMVTEALKKDAIEKIRKYYGEKGFMKVETDVVQISDGKQTNSVSLILKIDKGAKVHVNQINFAGNDNANSLRLKRAMKGTKEMPRLSIYPADAENLYGSNRISFSEYMNAQGYLSGSKTLETLDPYLRWKIFANSKFNPTKYDEDKNSVVGYYNSIGYRDAGIDKDTAYYVKNGNLNIDIKMREGRKYYFGDIQWRGNTKYSDSMLSKILSIKRGDVFDGDLLNQRLNGSPNGDDIASLYMDDGYLFFRVDPIEKSVVGDTINYEIVITEGPQANIGKISISGNDRTNDYVLRRELFTLPGRKFSRSDVIRSIRQLSNLGFIDPEKVDPQMQPNLSKGTVDINYNVTEKSSDQLELSAGYGGAFGFTGSLGLVFNNFSLRNILNFKEWDPVPMGDGQKLSIRYQSSGLYYNSGNFSFTEPWLGGKKPTALTVSGFYLRYAQDPDPSDGVLDFKSKYIKNIGASVTLSKRLKWPDNNFIFSYGIGYQNYFLHNYSMFSGSSFDNGTSNNLNFRLSLSRSTVDQPIFPRSGSNLNFTFTFTPPYSVFSNINYANATDREKFQWIEYHKYRFTAEWYQKIAGNLVLKLGMKYGFLGYYNKQIGMSPFERFQVGGDGLSNFNMFVGRDIIALRGYDVLSNATSSTIFNKYTAEIRYPFSLNPSATIFGLAFVEAGNGWDNFKTYNPGQLYRTAGLGVRIYLPMFGLLGLDYGLGFDKLGPGVKVGSAFKFTFMLGQEPD